MMHLGVSSVRSGQIKFRRLVGWRDDESSSKSAKAAPCLRMLTSAAIYINRMGLNQVYCAKVFHDRRSTCPFYCHFESLFRES